MSKLQITLMVIGFIAVMSFIKISCIIGNHKIVYNKFKIEYHKEN